MNPIEGVSQIRRMPRLGKVRLGIKIEEEGNDEWKNNNNCNDYKDILNVEKTFVSCNLNFPFFSRYCRT